MKTGDYVRSLVNGKYGVVTSISVESTRITVKFSDGTESLTYLEDVQDLDSMCSDDPRKDNRHKWPEDRR